MATLQTSLEEVGRLRPTSPFNEAGYEWTVERLLQWLHQQFPSLLGRSRSADKSGRGGEIVSGEEERAQHPGCSSACVDALGSA